MSRRVLRTGMSLGYGLQFNKTGIGIIILLLVLAYFLYNHKNEPLDTPVEYISLKELLSASVDAAQRGGNKVRAVRENATLHMKSKGKTLEGVNDPVTDGDMLSHIEMFYSLKKTFPNIEIISEEHERNTVDVSRVPPADNYKSDIERAVMADSLVPVKGVKIWIDPLDATKEYTEDLRQYVTTMVCVAIEGKPTIGVIHKPFENYTAWGWVGYGRSATLHVADKKQSSDAVKIIVSLSHSGNAYEVARQAFGDNINIVKAGGAGYKTLQVIKGNADVYVHITLIKKWDLCAGHAILSALNGHMTTLGGEEILYDNSEEYKNQKGVLASLYNHDLYLTRFKNLQEMTVHR